MPIGARSTADTRVVRYLHSVRRRHPRSGHPRRHCALAKASAWTRERPDRRRTAGGTGRGRPGLLTAIIGCPVLRVLCRAAVGSGGPTTRWRKRQRGDAGSWLPAPAPSIGREQPRRFGVLEMPFALWRGRGGVGVLCTRSERVVWAPLSRRRRAADVPSSVWAGDGMGGSRRSRQSLQCHGTGCRVDAGPLCLLEGG